MFKRIRGQSTLEYVIILAAVVGAIILVANALKPKVVDTYGGLGDKMKNKVDSVSFDNAQ